MVPNEDAGKDDGGADEDDEALCEQRIVPAAVLWGRGPGSGV